MSSQKHIQDELRSLDSHLPFNNNHPYSVPEGYFDGLAAAILAKVKSSEISATAELGELSPLLSGIPKQMPYSVPASYFEENAEALPAMLQEPDSAMLNYIGKEMPYQVPYDYFDNLPGQILDRVARAKARVAPLFARTWMRVASAAAIIGALFFGGLQLFSSNTDGDNITAQQTTTTSEQSLVASNDAAITKEIKQVSTRDLEEFIETVQANAAKAPAAEEQATGKEEVEELLEDVTVTEMESFLSALPTAYDDLTLTD